MRRIFVVLVLLLAAALVAVGVIHPASPLAERKRITVAAGEGGAVLMGGMALALPEGASDQELHISIRRSRAQLPIVEDGHPLLRPLHRWIGPTFRLEASVDPGTLRKPLRVTIPLSKPAPPGSTTLIVYGTDDGWETVEAVVDANGLTASADVHHLSDWALPDIVGILSEAFRWVVEVAGLRTQPPGCSPPVGLTVQADANNGDPLAYWCARPAEDGDGYVVTVISNRGVPVLIRPTESLRLLTTPPGDSVVERLVREIYDRGKTVLVPAGSSVDFHYRPTSGPAGVEFEPTVASAVAEILLRLAKRLPVGKAAEALIKVVDCTRGMSSGSQSVPEILDKCLGGLGILGEQLRLEFPQGIKTTLRSLRAMFSTRDAIAAVDSLFDELGVLGRVPTFFRLSPPPPPKPQPPRPEPGIRVARTPAEKRAVRARVQQLTGRAPTHASVVGCH